ncbi:P-loop containing nucleoside triphosphate hydrolase protein [Filobasidium floriforme]|uniref:P-loop containing nucleoside triphosphate hydrolase protein n=1 Tax=Filobasidium floriforme TaxID=5210 RepID=UPI001E8DDF72|nr:P-loop containing nucleoside triphosphate hydrolase protein [Filobasidium floriforme]KAH8089781.1 P-loop containing nucleoside triphosphate hydrolase protein [Filobasidium floriforme]
MLLSLRFRAVRPVRNAAAHVRQASTAVNPGMSKITNLDKSAGDPHAKVRDMSIFPKDKIRNISIIAHIDHGKSTLADRLLEMTGTITRGPGGNHQVLDKLAVEKERGITVKAQTVSMLWTHTDRQEYLINLIDTPGHVDFSYEVSRSLGACEGCLLLVDASQGLQAQSLAVERSASAQGLSIIPCLNKIDLPHAHPAVVSAAITSTLGIPADSHMHISAKSGLGVRDVLGAVIDKLPPPGDWLDRVARLSGADVREDAEEVKLKRVGEDPDALRGLIIDTYYDRFRGVVSLIRVFTGTVKKGDKLVFMSTGKKHEVLEVGIFHPEETSTGQLYEGQVGYVVCNLKDFEEAHVGDTVTHPNTKIEPLPGFKPLQSMVFAGVFPLDATDFQKLEEAIGRLTLNDRSVTVQRESSAALGQGCRLGFLGTLHMSVLVQRLKDEYGAEVCVTAPTVPYKVVYKNGREEIVSNPALFPDNHDAIMRIDRVEEPIVHATILSPQEHVGDMMELCNEHRGIQLDYHYDEASGRSTLRYELPLSEIATEFFSKLKSRSKGYASFDYEDAGYTSSDLIKLNLLVNSSPVDALAMIVHRASAVTVGREWVAKLKKVIPRQLFQVSIQAAIGTKIIARESLSAMKKDVTAGLYGGHYERKMKQLEKQRRGKAKLKRLGAGNVEVPAAAFYEILGSGTKGGKS